MDESFDDELRKRLKQYAEEPATRLWHNIAVRKEAEHRPRTLLRRVRIGWIFLAGVLMLGGLYYFLDSQTKSDHSLALPGSERAQNNQIQNEAEGASGVTQPLLSPNNLDLTTKEIHSSLQNIHQAESANTAKAVTGESLLLGVIEKPGTRLEDHENFIENISEMHLSMNQQEAFDLVKEKSDSTETEIRVAEKKVFADENQSVRKTQEKKHDRFNIYFTIMPTFGYQRIKSNSHDNMIIEGIDRISAFSTERLGVRAELGAEDPITKRLTVFGGLVYFQRKQTIGYTEKQVDNTQILQDEEGNIILQPKFNYVHKSFEYELRNIGLQVGIAYQLSKKKILQTAGTGIEFHLALNKFRPSDQMPEFTNNPTAYVFYNLYYRMQYPSEGRLKAVLQPTLNYSFYINDNLNAPFYVKPYGLGLNIGCTYNF